MKPTHKFMMVLNKSVYSALETEADKRGITIQEYIRAIVIPQHMGIIHSTPQKIRKFDHSMRARKGWQTRRKNAQDKLEKKQEKLELQAKPLAYPGESPK